MAPPLLDGVRHFLRPCGLTFGRALGERSADVRRGVRAREGGGDRILQFRSAVRFDVRPYVRRRSAAVRDEGAVHNLKEAHGRGLVRQRSADVRPDVKRCSATSPA